MEEAVLSDTDQHRMVSSFLEIAVGQTADTARQFLQVLFELHRPYCLLNLLVFSMILQLFDWAARVLTDWNSGDFWSRWVDMLCVSVCNCVYAELVP